jgi:3-hydroxypropanoate dehydrogenase
MGTPLSDDGLDTIFRSARTFNHYTDRPVPETTLHAIWDVMKWAPTSANTSPARIVWCTSDAAKERLAALSSGTNGAKIRKAPVTAIIGYDTEFHEHLPKLFPHVDARPWFADPAFREEAAFRNSSLQGAYFLIAARALGLDTGPMSGFDNAGVDAAFFAGTTVKSNFISTLGYGDPATLHERLPRFAFAEANTIV